MDNEFQGLGFLPGVIIGIIIVAIFWGIGKHGKYEGQTAEDWFNEYDYCEGSLYDSETNLNDYRDALDEANNNIEEAKIYSGSSYDDMEYALYNLDTVSEP